VIILEGFHPNAQMLYTHRYDGLEVVRAQIVGMAFQMYFTPHIKDFVDVLQNLLQATIEHRCGRSATDIERGHRPIANQPRIDVDLLLNSVCVPFCYLKVIDFLVVRTVRADLATEGDVKIEAEFVYALKSTLEGGGLVFKCNIVLFGE